MNIIKNAIKKLKSPQGIKLSLSILLISIFFFAPTFAQESKDSEALENLSQIITKILEFLSRSWVILASLAGKLMTNDMVYWSWLNLDAYLWKLRNICKNFANFWLLAVLLRGVVQFIIKKGESIQKLVTQTLIAGILIQSSWFLIAAVLDVSTILTAAIWAFPNNFIDKSTTYQSAISKELAENIHSHYTKVDTEGNVSREERRGSRKEENPNREKDFVEKIMPNSDSIAWPLVYIWATTLKIQKALNFSENHSKEIKPIVTTSVLQLLMIGLYCVTLILLIIANIIRIALLWVVIPLSPLIILMITVGKMDKLGKNWLLKNFNLGVILHAIFKPALFTAVMWLILIFIVSMQNIMNWNDSVVEIQWTQVWVVKWTWTAIMENEWIFSVEINDTLFTEAQDTSKGIFSWLIIYFATIFMLRYMVKIAATTWWWTIWETMEKATWMVEWMASTAPIFRWYSARALQEWWKETLNKVGKASWVNLNFSWWNAGKLDSDERFRRFLDWKLWIVNTRYDSDYEKLIDSDDFIGTTKSMIGGLNQNSIPKREEIFNKKLKESKKIWIDEIDGKDNNIYFEEKKEKSLKTLNTDWFRLLHESLWWKSLDYPQNYAQFIQKIRNNEYQTKD